MVGLAIVLDNISEALSIGEMVFDTDKDKPKNTQQWEVIKRTGLIGISLLVSAVGGYFLLSKLSEFWHGSLTALGAGSMFYLATTGLVPEAESHQFEKSQRSCGHCWLHGVDSDHTTHLARPLPTPFWSSAIEQREP